MGGLFGGFFEDPAKFKNSGNGDGKEGSIEKKTVQLKIEHTLPNVTFSEDEIAAMKGKGMSDAAIEGRKIEAENSILLDLEKKAQERGDQKKAEKAGLN
jgi:hypothetical protein